MTVSQESTVVDLEAKKAENARILEEAHASKETWVDDLRFSKNGTLVSNHANVATYLENHSMFKNKIRYNALKVCVEIRDWMEETSGGEWWPVEDNFLIKAMIYLQRTTSIGQLQKTMAADVLEYVGKQDTVHPIRDYLNGIEWDGVSRLELFAETYLGTKLDDNAEYVRMVPQMWLLSAVKRIMHPGCQADYVLILEGVQGETKTTAIEALVPDKAWFDSQAVTIGTKDSLQTMSGKWIIELSELAGMGKRQHEINKAFFSRKCDYFRSPYAHYPCDVKRQCVFVGTVNPGNLGYLSDPTGERRYWPIETGRIDRDRIARDRDQIWAEAVRLLKDGAKTYIPRDLEHIARKEQGKRSIIRDDPWHNLVLRVAMEGSISGRRKSSQDILELLDGDVTIGRRDQGMVRRVSDILTEAGGNGRNKSRVGECAANQRQNVWDFPSEIIEQWKIDVGFATGKTLRGEKKKQDKKRENEEAELPDEIG